VAGAVCCTWHKGATRRSAVQRAHFFARFKRSAVNLREAGGGEGLLIEGGEDLINWLAQLFPDELLGTLG